MKNRNSNLNERKETSTTTGIKFTRRDFIERAAVTAAMIGFGAEILSLTGCDERTIEFSERLQREWSPSVEPAWSSERDADLETIFGDVRVFSASSWEVDLNLLQDLINTYGMFLDEKTLELRLFNDNYVTRDPNTGFGLSQNNGEIGLTVEGPSQVISVIPTGWAFNTKGYHSQYEGIKSIYSTSEMFITMDIIHELLVHGINRAAGVPRTDIEEEMAQAFERKVYYQLEDRPLVRMASN
jgi:hypothetical protein